jgi:glycosyltransferase involved in cell wall biosynthesis
VLRRLRNRSLCAAELNVALSERMAEHLVGERIPRARIAVIHNWADGGLIRPIPHERNPLRKEWGLEGRRVIGYSGNLGRAHDLPAIRNFIAAMGAADPELVFLFIGGGAGVAELESWARAGRTATLMVRPYQPRDRLAQSLSVPDAHLVALDPACEGLIMPSKLYAALAAGRPVVALGDPAGVLAGLVRDLDAGIVWSPGSEAGLLARLDHAGDPAATARLRRIFEARFARAPATIRWQAALAATRTPALAGRTMLEQAA